MSRFAEGLKGLGRDLIRSVRDFPVEALLGAVYFIIFLFGKRIDARLEDVDLFNLFLWFIPHYVLVFILHRLSKGRQVLKAAYFLSWFLWIPLLFLCTRLSSPDWAVAVSYLLAAVLLVAGDRRLDNEEFGQGVFRTVVRIGICFLIGGLMMAVISAIIASVGYLFGLKLADSWFEIPNAFIAMSIIPLLCCRAVSDSRPVQRGSKLLNTVVDGILSPALIIYTAILYGYIIRILIRWELPNGGVAYMVTAFIAIALLCCMCLPLLSKRHFDWFYKAFPAIAIPPLALLWVGIFRRTGEYGLTEARFYLILLAALMTLFTAMLASGKTRKFQSMALVLAAAAAFFTYIPGIRAKDFGIRSQQKRLEAVLPLVLEGGSFPEDPDYAAIFADSTRLEAWRTAESSWSYLKGSMTKDSFDGKYGQFGQMPANGWILADKTHWPETTTVEPDVHELEGPIDLQGYTVLVPSSQYHYYEDGKEAVFYLDDTKGEELLRCGIAGRLEAGAEGNDVLVFQNEEYMAVFTYVVDLREASGSEVFRTGTAMLFKKAE